MDLSPDRFGDRSKREIIRELIEHVTTSEEGFEEKEHRSGQSTDLNLYVLDNQGFEIGSLDSHINYITESELTSGYAKNFVKDHTFSETEVAEDTSIIQITTPEKGRTDDSLWMDNDDYLWVLTTVPADWREKTIENLIKYLPQVERLYLSSDYLRDLNEEIIDSYVSGFTAEYHSPKGDRKATLRFHGARETDLDKAKEAFDATPTRIEFDQTNSPAAAIQGASVNDGRITIQSVKDGSQSKAVDTLMNTSESYQSLDQQSFEIEHRSTHEKLENGFSIQGFTAIELTNPDRESGEELMDDLLGEVLNSNQYRYGKRGTGRLRVYDKKHEEFFDIALEDTDIILYPRPSTTSLSLRSFVQDIFEDFDSTYSLDKVESAVAAN